jgi:SAM-dependent methyltransferase
MRALLLGVTPDIATLNWPSGSTLIALDNSKSVIGAIWPGNVPSRRWATCANWLSMPLQQGSCDFAVGDGSFNAFCYPSGWKTAASSIRNVLTEGGVLVLRCYVRPDEPENPDDVIRELLGPGIADINHFKFRLFLAMQRSTEVGCEVREIYQFLKGRVSEDALRSMPGWSEAAVRGFELWRDADTVYTFPTLSEIREVLSQHFCERAVSFPTYALGNNCPTLMLSV